MLNLEFTENDRWTLSDYAMHAARASALLIECEEA
jgi:hypothetical protein